MTGSSNLPAAALLGSLVDWRRTLHRTPEPAFAEHIATAFVRAALGGLGLREVALATATGAAFLIEGREPGPRILVRADLDALPITEATGLPFASTVPAMMHACGHDAHTAMLIGLGHRLSAMPPIRGSVMLLFQPAEEVLGGALAVLADGFLDRLEVDAVLGSHITPMLPTGRFGIGPGTLLAGAVGYRVTIRGSGGHGARRRRQGDALSAAAALVERLQSVVPSVQPATGPPSTAPLPTVAVCQLHAGTASNVSAEHAELTGTVRYGDRCELPWRQIQQLMVEHADRYGVHTDLQRSFATPPLVNDPDICATVSAALATRFSLGALHWQSWTLPTSDDFAEFLTRRPGCYFLIGAAAADRRTRVAHSPRFDIDESALLLGVDALHVAVEAMSARLHRSQGTAGRRRCGPRSPAPGPTPPSVRPGARGEC